jgi:hypothetical protein
MSAELLGVAGACVVAAAGIYYIIDVFRGNSRPHAGSWLVWSVIGVLGYGTTAEAGAGPGSYAAGVYVVLCATTFVISLRPRFGKPGLEWYDWPLCAVAIAGILLWRLGPLSGAAAVTLALACDLVGLWPTVREAWRAPALESPAAWSADAVGNLLCLFAVAEVSYTAIVYPAYLFAGTALVATILIVRSRHADVRVGDTEEPTAARR